MIPVAIYREECGESCTGCEVCAIEGLFERHPRQVPYNEHLQEFYCWWNRFLGGE